MAIKEKNKHGHRKTTIFQLITQNNIQQFYTILKYGTNVNIRDSMSRIPLMHAACMNKEETRLPMVRALILKGANVNAQDNSGRTTLMYACGLLGREDVIGQLLKARHCDPNIQDMNGNTAIMHAVLAGNAMAVHQIVNAQYQTSPADPNRRNNKGYTPLSLAVKLQQAECCRVLVNDAHANHLLVPDQANLKRLLREDYVKSWIVQNRNEVGYRLPLMAQPTATTNYDATISKAEPNITKLHISQQGLRIVNHQHKTYVRTPPIKNADNSSSSIESTQDCERFHELTQTSDKNLRSTVHKSSSKEEAYRQMRSLFTSRITFSGGMKMPSQPRNMLLVTSGHLNVQPKSSGPSTSPLTLPSIFPSGRVSSLACIS